MSGMWTWQGGSTTISARGVYGTKGVAAATNYPGARAGGGYKDTSGNVWLFGGTGYDSTGTLGSLNDLWEYSPSSQLWTWVGGSNTVNAKGVYGTQGVAAATNMPGARHYTTTWTDAAGNFWMFGGVGFDSTGALNVLNDLWKYSPSSNQWIWVGGSNTVNAPGVYGTQGVAATTNVPGARDSLWVWNDGSNVWLFGGEGLNTTGADPNAPVWNDLWKYPIR